MALFKLGITPTQAGYSVQDGREVVATQLDGGAARYRRDILNANMQVSASWVLSKDGYEYIRGFYKTLTESGSLPFLIDLILDNGELTEHQAHFVPNSVRMNGQDGGRYYVSADLEVKPIEQAADQIEFLVLYGEYGDTYSVDFPIDENDLNNTVNVEMPGYL